MTNVARARGAKRLMVLSFMSSTEVWDKTNCNFLKCFAVIFPEPSKSNRLKTTIMLSFRRFRMVLYQVWFSKARSLKRWIWTNRGNGFVYIWTSLPVVSSILYTWRKETRYNRFSRRHLDPVSIKVIWTVGQLTSRKWSERHANWKWQQKTADIKLAPEPEQWKFFV